MTDAILIELSKFEIKQLAFLGILKILIHILYTSPIYGDFKTNASFS